MIKLFLQNNLFFYLLNLILISLYLSPTSITNIFLYNDSYFYTEVTPDFKISYNHLYVFLIFSIASFITYKKINHLIFLSIYLIFLSIILELTHIIIPYRNFEFADLFGNIFGVITAFIIIFIYKKYSN
jgi:hypothetical protein